MGCTCSRLVQLPGQMRGNHKSGDGKVLVLMQKELSSDRT